MSSHDDWRDKSRQPISNADVNIEIYAPNGDLLWSDQMVEMENGNGVYIWESEETIQDIMKGPHWQLLKVSTRFALKPHTTMVQ